MKNRFYQISFLTALVIGVLGLFATGFLWLYLLVLPLFCLGLYDLNQRKHTILRNFPVIGHFRFWLEVIAPEIHQYLIESDLDGRPIPRERRSIVYERAKGTLDTLPYGTRWNVYQAGYEWINHSMLAKRPTELNPRITVGTEQCSQPYSASFLNISAMSYGALSQNAVLALNQGAKEGNFYHNTGEGGLSPYHLKPGGDIVWQIGTAYFGCRTPDGKFSAEHFSKRARLPQVKMIELKISQGAKPGHGGILPAVKVTQEIADIRLVPMGQDVLSPPTHSAFSTPIEMMHFIAELRELCGGKPVGFKLCVGSRRDFFAICKAILETNILPDFITVDGGEGGTGAAPLEFSNAVGTPGRDALQLVHNALIGIGLRDKIRVIYAGKLITGYHIVSALAHGADMCNQARAMMLALGCVQSLKCNTNRCPTGVTTQDPKLMNGLVVTEKYKRVARYHEETVKAVMEVIGAAGLTYPWQLKPNHIYRRISGTEALPLDQIYTYLEPGALLAKPLPEQYAKDWDAAKASTFV